MNAEHDWPLRIGLLLVSFSWFSFTLYEFTSGIIHREISPMWILVTDTPGVLGLGFRTVAGFIAVVTILFYIFKRDLSGSEAIMSLRLIVIIEAAYYLSIFPSGVWGFATYYDTRFLIETGLPCIVESIVIPVVLVKMFFELNPNKTARGAIKWGLILGNAYLFVFWLNNTCNWIPTIMEKGTEYVSLYPVNLLSFGITIIGLLLLALFTAYFSKRSVGAETLTKLNLRKVGMIVTAFGLYFDLNYLLWLFFGSVGGWSTWYAWFLGHNMDLWALSLPLVGLPLLFRRKE
jgi:hypothetical protein